MSRRNSGHQQSLIASLREENERLRMENNNFLLEIQSKNEKLLFYSNLKNQKEQEYNKLKATKSPRRFFLIITLLIMFLCWICVGRMEEKDHTLLHSSSREIFHLIKQQISKFIDSPQAQCIALIIIFNFITCIVCQMTFPCPKPLFWAIFLQIGISLISIFIPEFIMIFIFSITCWIVPLILALDADKAIETYSTIVDS